MKFEDLSSWYRGWFDYYNLNLGPESLDIIKCHKDDDYFIPAINKLSELQLAILGVEPGPHTWSSLFKRTWK